MTGYEGLHVGLTRLASSRRGVEKVKQMAFDLYREKGETHPRLLSCPLYVSVRQWHSKGDGVMVKGPDTFVEYRLEGGEFRARSVYRGPRREQAQP